MVHTFNANTQREREWLPVSSRTVRLHSDPHLKKQTKLFKCLFYEQLLPWNGFLATHVLQSVFDALPSLPLYTWQAKWEEIRDAMIRGHLCITSTARQPHGTPDAQRWLWSVPFLSLNRWARPLVWGDIPIASTTHSLFRMDRNCWESKCCLQTLWWKHQSALLFTVNKKGSEAHRPQFCFRKENTKLASMKYTSANLN